MGNKGYLYVLFAVLILSLSYGASVTAANVTQQAPVISNPYPMDNSSYVNLNTTLNVTIIDYNADSINWSVRISDLTNGGNFIVLGSGTDSDGNITLSLNVSGKLTYDTTYLWVVIISAPDPIDGGTGIGRFPSLKATIYDVDMNPVNWTIQLYSGSSWIILDQGSSSSGSLLASTSNISNINLFNTSYKWKVTAVDPTGSKITTEQNYTFTTKLSNTIPVISNTYPANGSIDIAFNPTISANIYDSDGKVFNWTVQAFDGSQWTVFGSGVDTTGNITLSVPTSGLNAYNSAYQWKLKIVDLSGMIPPIENVYPFTSRQAIYPLRFNSTPFDGDTISLC